MSGFIPRKEDFVEKKWQVVISLVCIVGAAVSMGSYMRSQAEAERQRDEIRRMMLEEDEG